MSEKKSAELPVLREMKLQNVVKVVATDWRSLGSPDTESPSWLVND
jgi:hypothetical protein